MTREYTRRRIVGTVGATGIAAFSGCTAGYNELDRPTEEPETVPDLLRVENPPDAVYVPTHREAMRHLPTTEAGEYVISPMVTYPHSFWLVTGSEREEVVPNRKRGVHLMMTVLDRETGQVLPVDAGAQMRVLTDGEMIDRRAPWPMISQTMGFHFGDNVPLPADGTYTVEVDLNPIDTRKTGAFVGRFDERATARFEFEYDEAFREEVIGDVQYLDEDDWGRRGALEPSMAGDHHDENGASSQHVDGLHGSDEHGDGHGGHRIRFSALPEPGAYPGVNLGEYESGDARFVVQYLFDSRFADGGYLLVSPRTPYNRVPLADMALATAGAIETNLEQTLDSELGLHYGAEIDLSAGAEFDLVVEGPPQVARHAGYETAFLEMPPMSVVVPE